MTSPRRSWPQGDSSCDRSYGLRKGKLMQSTGVPRNVLTRAGLCLSLWPLLEAWWCSSLVGATPLLCCQTPDCAFAHQRLLHRRVTAVTTHDWITLKWALSHSQVRKRNVRDKFLLSTAVLSSGTQITWFVLSVNRAARATSTAQLALSHD